MKKYIKSLSLVLLILLGACETTQIDLRNNPNFLDPSQATADAFINAIQVDFATFVNAMGEEAAEVSRILYMFGRNYQNAYAPTDFDIEWTDAYQKILQDVREMNTLAEEAEQFYHIGMGQVIEAYTLVTMVDMFGDIPYSEAFMGADNFNPNVDPGADVYATALSLLDQAIANFQRDVPASLLPASDLYYQGNWNNWIKAANSIKLKMYLTTRLVDPNAVASFNAIINSGEYITSNDEDFQFSWGTNNDNPDSRHPEYVDRYTPSGTAGYMSNWLMGYMQLGKVGNGIATFEDKDPRMQYYFYRQASSIPNDANLINCIAETDPPAHYRAGDVYCDLPEGYWGRDHGNDDGGPPDTQSRTAMGVYPIGGLFDDGSFQAIASVSLGAGGAGITPIMLASWVDMMRAEVALVGNDNGGARQLMLDGVTKSFAKVRAFGAQKVQASLLDSASSTNLDTDYVTELGQIFDASAGDQGALLDLLGSEYFVTLFGNGLDGYNFYRRTGRPSTLQLNVEENPGSFIRSFFYPPRFVERNSSVSQKSGCY